MTCVLIPIVNRKLCALYQYQYLLQMVLCQSCIDRLHVSFDILGISSHGFFKVTLSVIFLGCLSFSHDFELFGSWDNYMYNKQKSRL